jgi:hypothetical protein
VEWHDEARQECAEQLRWLADVWESGRLTADRVLTDDRWGGPSEAGFTTMQLGRQITQLVGMAEQVRYELDEADENEGGDEQW